MKKLKILALLVMASGLLLSCNDKNGDPDISEAVAFVSAIADGSATETTSKLILSFDKDIPHLAASDIALTPGETGAAKGILTSRGGGIYELTLTGITAGGQITAGLQKPGYMISPASRSASVYFYRSPTDIPVNFADITADGSPTQTTTALTLEFSAEIPGLDAGDITLTAGTTGTDKGGLTYIGVGKYELAVNGITEGGEIAVSVTKEGYAITPSSHPVTVCYYVPPTDLTGAVAISGTARIGETLTAVTDGLNATDGFSYRWSKAHDAEGPYTDMDMGNGNSYTIVGPDIDVYIKVTVESIGYNGSVTSAASAKVASSWIMAEDSGFGAANNTIYKVAYGGSKFVAVGQSGKIAWSDDAENWTLVDDSKFEGSGISNVFHVDNKFFAVGSGGKMSASGDAVNWTSVASGFGASPGIRSMAYGNNKYVAVGSQSRLSYSTDGVNWTGTTIEEFGGVTFVMSDIVFANGKFVVAGDGGKILSSADGLAWTAHASGTTDALYTITYADGKFVAAGVDGTIVYSTDGVNWTAVTDNLFPQTIRQIVYADGIFVAVGHGATIAWSEDAENWIVSDNPFTGNIMGVTYGDGKFVCAGADGQIAFSSVAK